MGCLDNLIGIRTCNVTNGTSPYYIEDIGITVTEANQYINNNYISGQELIEDKIRLAAQLVRDLIYNHFSSYIITKSLMDNDILGQYQDSLNLKSGVAGKYGGVSLTLTNTNNYLNVSVNSISLQVDYTGDIDVLVYDLISGTVLDTVVVTCVPNVISTTVVNKVYAASGRKLDLVFLYDTEGINSNTTNLSSDCGTCNGFRYNNYYISAQSVTANVGDTIVRSALTSNSHTFGLSVNYSVQCALDNWLCEMANLMALPILYKSGMEIMEYATLYSNRQTSTINIDFERNKERLAAYTSKFNEALMATVQRIVIPKYNKCFVCDDAVRMNIVLP